MRVDAVLTRCVDNGHAKLIAFIGSVCPGSGRRFRQRLFPRLAFEHLEDFCTALAVGDKRDFGIHLRDVVGDRDADFGACLFDDVCDGDVAEF